MKILWLFIWITFWGLQPGSPARCQRCILKMGPACCHQVFLFLPPTPGSSGPAAAAATRTTGPEAPVALYPTGPAAQVALGPHRRRPRQHRVPGSNGNKPGKEGGAWKGGRLGGERGQGWQGKQGVSRNREVKRNFKGE